MNFFSKQENRFICSDVTLLFGITLLVTFQSSIIHWLIRSQFSFSLSTVLSLLTKEDHFSQLQQQLMNSGVLLGLFLLIELLLLLGIASYLLTKIERKRRLAEGEQRKKTLVLLLSHVWFFLYLFFFIGKFGIQSFLVGLDVHARVAQLTNADILGLQNAFNQLLQTTSFSMTYFFRDMQTFVTHIQTILASVEQVANIPSLVQQWHWTVQQNYLYLQLGTGLNFLIVLGLGVQNLGKFPTFYSGHHRMLQNEERLLRILEQQQLLLEKIQQTSASTLPVAPSEAGSFKADASPENTPVGRKSKKKESE